MPWSGQPRSLGYRSLAAVESLRASIVATGEAVTEGPYPKTKAVIGGFVIIDAHSRERALEWATKFSAACRCT